MSCGVHNRSCGDSVKEEATVIDARRNVSNVKSTLEDISITWY